MARRRIVALTGVVVAPIELTFLVLQHLKGLIVDSGDAAGSRPRMARKSGRAAAGGLEQTRLLQGDR